MSPMTFLLLVLICLGLGGVALMSALAVRGGVGWLRPLVCGVAILLFLGSWFGGIVAMAFSGWRSPDTEHILLLLVTGPTSFLLASFLAFWHPRAAGIWLTVTAVGLAMAAILVMTPLPEVPFYGDNLAYYVFRWSLGVILPFSLPVLILGMWFLVTGGDLGLIRRRWVQYSVQAILVLAISVSIVAAWFAIYVGRATKLRESAPPESPVSLTTG